MQLGVWRRAVSSPSGVWSRAAAEIEFAGGNNFNNVPENQLTKVRAG